jgi:hypothetical protein
MNIHEFLFWIELGKVRLGKLEYLTGKSLKFKSVYKFKIVCDDLQTVMVPLPDCASGEWGKNIC